MRESQRCRKSSTLWFGLRVVVAGMACLIVCLSSIFVGWAMLDQTHWCEIPLGLGLGEYFIFFDLFYNTPLLATVCLAAGLSFAWVYGSAQAWEGISGSIFRYIVKATVPACLVFSLIGRLVAVGFWDEYQAEWYKVTAESLLTSLSPLARVVSMPVVWAFLRGWGFSFIVLYSMLWGLVLWAPVELLIFGVKRRIARKRGTDASEKGTPGSQGGEGSLDRITG